MKLFEIFKQWLGGGIKKHGHLITPMWVVPKLDEGTDTEDLTARKDWADIGPHLEKEKPREP